MHNGAHLTLAPAVVDALRGAGLETPVVVGGIVPPDDVPILLEAGVAAVLGPGASNEEVVATVHGAVGQTGLRTDVLHDHRHQRTDPPALRPHCRGDAALAGSRLG